MTDTDRLRELARDAAHFRDRDAQRDDDARLRDELLDLLAVMFDAYEDGDPCYDDFEELSGYCGNAVRLDEATFNRIADILNTHRPRTTMQEERNG